MPFPNVTAIEAAWVLLIVAAPALCWRCGQASGVGGAPTAAAVVASLVLAVAAVAQRGDEPLHANGHAWREAREVLMPVGVRLHGVAPFMHGKGGIALAWVVAAVERRLTGRTRPFLVSRVAGAAAAGGAALLASMLVQSPWAGLAAGTAVALMPLARMLAVSGSALAIPEWILPASLALLLAAGTSGSRALLAGATLAIALGTLSHTAMLAWPAASVVAWLIVARRETRESWPAAVALAVVGVAWLAQVDTTYGMVAERDSSEGFLAAALRGFELRNLFLSPHWVSPVLAPLLVLFVAVHLRRERWAPMAASIAAAAIVAPPFFAVTTCSSDAVRYQGALVGLAASLAVAGAWRVPLARWLGRGGAALARAGVVAALVALPRPAMQEPPDPATVEHRLVVDAARRMSPGTLVILPAGRWFQGMVITDFPDFLLPPGSRVLLQDDPRIAQHRGPRLLYLGLACVSWVSGEPGAPSGDHPTGMRPECRALRADARPWMVRSLGAADLPREDDGQPWTYHVLSLDEPFGFFEP